MCVYTRNLVLADLVSLQYDLGIQTKYNMQINSTLFVLLTEEVWMCVIISVSWTCKCTYKQVVHIMCLLLFMCLLTSCFTLLGNAHDRKCSSVTCHNKQSYGQFRILNLPYLCVFGLLEENETSMSPGLLPVMWWLLHIYKYIYIRDIIHHYYVLKTRIHVFLISVLGTLDIKRSIIHIPPRYSGQGHRGSDTKSERQYLFFHLCL